MPSESGHARRKLSRREFLRLTTTTAVGIVAASPIAGLAAPVVDVPPGIAGNITRSYLPLVQAPYQRPAAKTLYGPHWIPYHFEAGDASFFRDWGPGFVKIVCDGLEVPYVRDVPDGAAIIVRHYPSSELNGQRGFAGYATAAGPSLSPNPAAYYGGEGSGRDLLRQAQTLHTVRDPQRTQEVQREEAGVGAALMTPEEAAEMQAGVARQMAERLEAQGHALKRFWFEGLNEPLLWSTEPPEAVARLERRRLELMHAAGLNSVVLNCGVGWPGNGGAPDAPVQWDWFKPVVEVWGSHDLLGLHEYCGLNGPQENWRWWMGRYQQCPFALAILISETGIDGGVVPGQEGTGWLDLPLPSVRERARQYIDQLAWYEQELLKDPRVMGAVIYTYDGGGWDPFNIKISDWQLEWQAWLATRP